MVDVSPSDFFEVRRESLFSSMDRNYLYDFYAPIVGIKAISIFEALLSNNEGEVFSHLSFFTRNQISAGEFINAMRPLEAIALVRTFQKQNSDKRMLVYCLYAPRNPNEFFGNVLLAGTLRRYLPQNECDALVKKYNVLPLPSDFEEASEHFTDYFSPDLASPLYKESVKETGGLPYGSLYLGFDKNQFLASIGTKDPRFNEKAFSEEELTKIARYGALYGYSEEALADFASDSFSFSKTFGSRLDFKNFSRQCEENVHFKYLSKAPAAASEARGNTHLARMIRKMDDLTPVEFLTGLQRGNRPAAADLDLLNELTVDMGVPNNVCNALVFYVLEIKDSVLNARYVEKIAGSLVRKGFVTALDALNYLGETGKPRVKKETMGISAKKITPQAAEPVRPIAQASKESNDDISDEEYKSLLENYGKKEGGKE